MSQKEIDEIDKEAKEILMEMAIYLAKKTDKHPLALISAFHTIHLGLLDTLNDKPGAQEAVKEIAKQTIAELEVLSGERQEIRL